MILFAACLLVMCNCQAPYAQILPKAKSVVSVVTEGHSGVKHKSHISNTWQYVLLQGVWTDCSSCNALFTIRGRRIIYFDSGDEGTKDEIVYWKISGNNFFWIFSNNIVIKERILKMFKDSLVLCNESGVVTKLIRMK